MDESAAAAAAIAAAAERRLGYQYEVVTVTSPVMRAQHA
jgi:hypothetical protein